MKSLFVFSLAGYDPYSNPPNYGNADDVVKENTNKVRREKGFTEHILPLLLICWLDWSLMRIVDLIWQNIFLLSFLVALQVKNNQKLWDHKVKQLLKRDEENEENDDNQDDNPNDVERTWWGEWVNTKMSSFLSLASNVWAFYHLWKQWAAGKSVQKVRIELNIFSPPSLRWESSPQIQFLCNDWVLS